MIKNLPKNRFAAIVALFISLFMPTLAKAQEAYAVEDGTTLTFYYDDQRTNRTGTVYGINQKREDDNYHPAWAGSYSVKNDRITKVVFDASFKNFLPTSTAYWFYNCTALATIERIENLNTANVTEMYSMFEGCSALTALDLSNFNTEKVTNMSFMFDGCKALTSLDLSNFNTENVTNMRSMFWGCSSLTTLDVTGFNTAKVTNMLGIFFGCSALTSLDVSGFVTDNVAIMDGMFNGCSKLTTIDVSGFNTEKVTDMHNMFNGCKALTSLDLSNFNTAKVTDMNSMFNGCSALTKLDVSNFNTENVTNMSWIFYSCKSLTSLDVSNFNTAKVTTMSSMFRDCSALTSLDVSSFNTTNVTNMNSMFYGCSALTTIYCNRSWTCSNSSSMFSFCTSLKGYVSYNANYTTAIAANPNWYFTKLDSRAYAVVNEGVITFYYDNQTDNRTGTVFSVPEAGHAEAWVGSTNETITKTVFDVSFYGYVPSSTAYWFCNFNALKTIEGFGNLNTESVTDMTRMFYNCNSLESLDLSTFNTTNVTDMTGMFYNCNALTSLNVSNFKTNNVTFMSGMFEGCSALTSLNLSSFNTMKVADISSMFSGCESLTSLDVSKFSVDKVVNMKHMFSDCAQLTTIVCDDAWSCPDSKKMFDDCTKLKGAAEYDESMTDAAMANPETGYFTRVGASSVSEVNADTESGATGTYNMLGVKMHDDLQSLSAGIYIVNGKKVIVK